GVWPLPAAGGLLGSIRVCATTGRRAHVWPTAAEDDPHPVHGSRRSHARRVRAPAGGGAGGGIPLASAGPGVRGVTATALWCPHASGSSSTSGALSLYYM